MAAVQNTSFGRFLVQIQTRDTKNSKTCVYGILFVEILLVLVSYVDKKTLLKLMRVSGSVLKELVQSNIRIPLLLCVNSDFGDILLLAKSNLKALEMETKLRFSLELRIHSNCAKWADDLNVLMGLDSYGGDAEVVTGIAIGNLHVDLEPINEYMAKCISSMGNLQTLDLTGYHCNVVNIFDMKFVPHLGSLSTLQRVKVNPCSVKVLPIICMTNKKLHTIGVYGNGGGGDRSRIFSIFPELSVVELRKLSLQCLRVVTAEESEDLRNFVDRQRQLSTLSLSSCEVSEEACDNIVGMLKQKQLETLNLHRLHMGQLQLRRVIEQIGNMTQLKSLKVTDNHCNETNTESLCSGLGNMTSLRRLNLSYLSLSAHGVSELAGALTNLQRLQQLDLSNNRFHDISVSSLVAALIAFSKLTRLRLDNCGMTENVRMQMQPVLQKQI